MKNTLSFVRHLNFNTNVDVELTPDKIYVVEDLGDQFPSENDVDIEMLIYSEIDLLWLNEYCNFLVECNLFPKMIIMVVWEIGDKLGTHH